MYMNAKEKSKICLAFHAQGECATVAKIYFKEILYDAERSFIRMAF